MVMCEDGATAYGPGKDQVIPSPSTPGEIRPAAVLCPICGVNGIECCLWSHFSNTYLLSPKHRIIVQAMCEQHAFSEEKSLSVTQIKHAAQDPGTFDGPDVTKELKKLRKYAQEWPWPWFKVLRRNKNQYFYWIEVPPLPAEVEAAKTAEPVAAEERTTTGAVPQPRDAVFLSIMVHYYFMKGQYWEYHLCGTIQPYSEKIPPSVGKALDFAVQVALLKKWQRGLSYRITQKGRAYVKGLLQVPMPVQTWVIPERS